MKLYRISNCNFINDLSGTGAAAYGGRWNSKGTYILYTAATPSLALLETVVHLSVIPLKGFCMVTLDVPENSIQEIKLEELPAHWQRNPSPDDLKKFGDAFIKKAEKLLLKIPSAVMPEEANYLVNPQHADFKKVKVVAVRAVPIDERIVKNKKEQKGF